MAATCANRLNIRLYYIYMLAPINDVTDFDYGTKYYIPRSLNFKSISPKASKFTTENRYAALYYK